MFKVFAIISGIRGLKVAGIASLFKLEISPIKRCMFLNFPWPINMRSFIKIGFWSDMVKVFSSRVSRKRTMKVPIKSSPSPFMNFQPVFVDNVAGFPEVVFFVKLVDNDVEENYENNRKLTLLKAQRQPM